MTSESINANSGSTSVSTPIVASAATPRLDNPSPRSVGTAYRDFLIFGRQFGMIKNVGHFAFGMSTDLQSGLGGLSQKARTAARSENAVESRMSN